MSPRQRAPAVVAASDREACVAQLVRALGRGRGALVLGDTGVGKTHLVSQVLAALPPELTTGFPDTGELAPAAPYQSAAPFAGLAQLLGLGRTPASERDAMLAGRDRLATARRGGRPPLLRVEGAHLLDQASADAISSFARHGEIILVATARPVAGSTSPWHELWREDTVDRIDVSCLSPAEVERMLVAELGAQVSSETVRSLWAETGGNAFHLHEFVADQRAAGTLVERDGVWLRVSEPVVGERLLQATHDQLDGLDERALSALEALALLGPQTLGSFLDVVDRQVVDDLLRRGLVRTTAARARPELHVELAHRLVGHAVRRRMPRSKRRSLLHDVGLSTAGGALSRQTVLLLLSEELPVATSSLREAVVAAFARGVPDDVVAIVDAVVAHAARLGLSETDVTALLLDRAEARRRLGSPAAALADVESAAARLRRSADTAPPDGEVPRLVVRLVRIRASIAQFQHDDVETALAAIDDGESWLALLPSPLERARWQTQLHVTRLAHLGFGGRHTEAQADAVRLLDTTTDPYRMLPLVCPTGLGLLQAGRFADARRILRRYRSVAATSAESRQEAAGDIAIVAFLSHLWAGDITALDGHVSTGLDLAHSAIGWTGVHLSRGLVAAARGAWSTARRDLHAANVRASVGDPGSTSFSRAAEAWAAAAAGDSDGARALLAGVDSVPRRATAVLEGELQLLRLDTLMWLQEPTVHTAMHAVAQWAGSESMTRVEMEALHRASVHEHRHGFPTAEATLARMRALARTVRTPRAAALMQHVEALATGDRDLLSIAERELNRRGLWLPPGPQALALTAREREIAALAVSRLTSRAIATLLELSARTVDSHLASVFTKLGIRSREDLRHAMY